MGDHLTDSLISFFTACTTQLKVCEKLLGATWNYTYRNLEIPCKIFFYQKVEVLGTSCRKTLVSYDSCKRSPLVAKH